MEKTEDLLEDSWFFGNLLYSKTRTISRSYSDLAFSSIEEDVIKNERKNSSFSSRKPQPITPPSLTRTPSLPNSIETRSFLMKKPDPSPKLMPFQVRIDKKDVIIKNDPKSSSLSSRKQPPVAPSSLTQKSSLSNSRETQSSQTIKPDPFLTRTSSMSTSTVGSDQEEEDDQESEFTLGRLIRQASMNSSDTSNPPQQTPAIPGGWVDKSSEDMKAHIKFWARAVASNVRQECS